MVSVPLRVLAERLLAKPHGFDITFIQAHNRFFSVPYSCILLVKDKCQIESEKEH